MIFKISYGSLSCELKTPSTEYFKLKDVEMSGDRSCLQLLRKKLTTQTIYGFQGHTFDPESTTNLDLSSAIHNLEDFQVKETIPTLVGWVPPDNAQS